MATTKRVKKAKKIPAAAAEEPRRRGVLLGDGDGVAVESPESAKERAAKRGRAKSKKVAKKLGKSGVKVKARKKLARLKKHYDPYAYLRNDVARVVLLNVPEITGGDAFRTGQLICDEAERWRPKMRGGSPPRGRRFGKRTPAAVFEILCDHFPLFLEAFGATDPMFRNTPHNVALTAWSKWMGLMKTPKVEKLKKQKGETEGGRRVRIAAGDGDPMFDVLVLAEAFMIGGARAARTLQGGQMVAPDAKKAFQLALVVHKMILGSVPHAGIDYPATADGEHPLAAGAVAESGERDIAEEAYDFARETFSEVLQHGQQMRGFVTLEPSSPLVRGDLLSLWQRWLELLRHRVEERYKARAARVVRRARKLAKHKARKRGTTANP